MKLPIKILGSATALPAVVTSEELDLRLGLPIGTVKKTGGVQQRHFADATLKQSCLAAQAVTAALAQAGIELSQVDALVAACGVPEQAIPCNGVLIARELNMDGMGAAVFDVNSTCLSFLVALDVVSAQMAVHRYKTVVLVACDLASRGIDWKHMESACILGDGAAAFVLQFDETGESHVIASHLATFPEGWAACQITAGGTQVNPRNAATMSDDDFLFKMDGRAVFRMATQRVPQVLHEFWQKSNLTLDDIDWVVPHQASHLGMQHMQKLLNVPVEKIIDIYAFHGNQVAASIACTLHSGIAQNKIKRGDKVMLIGTGAGLSVGVLVLQY